MAKRCVFNKGMIQGYIMIDFPRVVAMMGLPCFNDLETLGHQFLYNTVIQFLDSQVGKKWLHFLQGGGCEVGRDICTIRRKPDKTTGSALYHCVRYSICQDHVLFGSF